MSKVTEYDAITGLTIVRDQTDAETAQTVADAVEAKTQTDAKIAKDAARQAVLDKLGLTADEAQTLFG
jgi:antitoxin component of RelBE/YafQ-DinJ toxin-antitoxin module